MVGTSAAAGALYVTSPSELYAEFECADDKAFYAEFDRRLAMAKEKLGLM